MNYTLICSGLPVRTPVLGAVEKTLPDPEKKELFAALKDNPRKAGAMLLAMARRGDADALFLQGLRRLDRGSTEGAKQAFDCFKKASKAGHRHAMVYLATAYRDGGGTRKNRATAERLFEKSANEGCVTAMAYLADHHLDGDLNKENVRKGLRWLILAAERKLTRDVPSVPRPENFNSLSEFIAALEEYWTVDAHEHLALRYDTGLPGLKRDTAKAAFYLDKVFRAGARNNAWELCRLYDETGQSSEAERVLEVLVAEGQREAMTMLGERLRAHGNSRERSIRGLQLLDRAAKTPPKPEPEPEKVPKKSTAKTKGEKGAHATRDRYDDLLADRNRLMLQARQYFEMDPPNYRLCIRTLHNHWELLECEPAIELRALLRARLGDEEYQSHFMINALA